MPATAALKAWTLLTALEELKGFEEQQGDRGRADRPIRAIFAGRTGSICARPRPNMPTAIPTVLVVGGGQAGLSIAARLKQLQVDTLIVDRESADRRQLAQALSRADAA